MKKAIVFLTAVCMFISSFSLGETIIFTYEGNGTGTLNGTTFTDSDFVITAFANMDDRQSFGNGYWINHLSASISIENLGKSDFLTGTRTFVNNPLNGVGFARSEPDSSADLFHAPRDALFSTWDMLSPIGPIHGTGQHLQWNNYPVIETTGGILFFASNLTDATFTAVPEPCTLLLLGVGAVMIRKRK